MNKDELIATFGFMGVISAFGGAVIALLSFEALSVLAICGIFCAFSGLFAAAFYSFLMDVGRASAHHTSWKDEISFTLPMFAMSFVISAATGVGLAAAVTYIFSGVSATLGGTVAVTAAIGFITPIIGVLALHLLPMVEKAIELCSSKEQGDNDLSRNSPTDEGNKSPSTSVNATKENPSGGISFSY